MATVTDTGGGGDYTSLKGAIDGAETTISIQGTFDSLPHETTDIDWDTASVSVTCDSDAAYDPTKPRTGGSYHWALHDNTGPYAIVATQAITLLESVEIKQTTTDTSDECIRIINSGTNNISKCLLWTGNATTDQDGVYCYHGYSPTVNITNSIIVDCHRAGVNYQKYAYSSGNTTTININSCTIFGCGDDNTGSQDGGVVAHLSNIGGTSEVDYYIYSSIICNNNNGSSVYDFQCAQSAADNTWTVDNCLYGTAHVDIETITDSTSGVVITDATPAASGEIYVTEDDTAPYDLSLVGTDSNCEALDMHSDGTGPNSMTIPSDDIMGTTRTAPYCAGAFEFAAAGGDLSINTSQSINLSEYINGQLSIAGINLFESIALTESVTIADLLLNLEINLAQQIELSESVSGFLNLAGITVDDSINISESIASFLSVAGISVADNIEIVENISPAMNLGAININEALELAEALTSGVPIGFEKFENITLAEFLSLLETIAPSAFDNITVTEYLALLKDIGLNEFENFSITESITAALQQAGLNIFDSISVEEFISILKDIGVDTSQEITITEVVSAIMLLAGIEAAEDVTINEALSLLMSLAGIDTAQSISITEFVAGLLSVAGVDVAENLTITEFINLLTTSDLPITDASENITISEAIEILFSHLPLTAEQNISIIESVTAALTTTGIDVSDSVNINEYALLILSLGLIDVSDSIEISEAITALLETTGANVYETITVNEFILNILEVAGVNVHESVTISEWVYVTMVTVAGLMRVSFAAKKPDLTYSTRRPKITFN